MNYISKIALLMNKKTSWAFLDQATISLTNFTASIILARSLGLNDYGVFALIFAIFIYLTNLQRMLIIAPMINLLSKPAAHQDHKHTNKSVTGVIFLFAIFTFLLCFFSIQLINWLFPNWGLVELSLPIALAASSFLLQDGLRRQLFTMRKVIIATITDTISYGGYVFILAVQYNYASLSLESALLTMSFIFLLGYVIGLFSVTLIPSVSTATRIINGKQVSDNLILDWYFIILKKRQ